MEFLLTGQLEIRPRPKQPRKGPGRCPGPPVVLRRGCSDQGKPSDPLLLGCSASGAAPIWLTGPVSDSIVRIPTTGGVLRFPLAPTLARGTVPGPGGHALSTPRRARVLSGARSPEERPVGLVASGQPGREIGEVGECRGSSRACVADTGQSSCGLATEHVVAEPPRPVAPGPPLISLPVHPVPAVIGAAVTVPATLSSPPVRGTSVGPVPAPPYGGRCRILDPAGHCRPTTGRPPVATVWRRRAPSCQGVQSATEVAFPTPSLPKENPMLARVVPEGMGTARQPTAVEPGARLISPPGKRGGHPVTPA